MNWVVKQSIGEIIRTMVLVVLAVTIATLPIKAQERNGLSDEDVVAIRSNLKFAGMDPINSPEEFFGQFSDDVYFNYQGRAADGMKELKEIQWCHTISGENTIKRIEGSGNLAYVRGRYKLSLNCEEPVNVEGDFVTIHRKEDASWKVALYIASQVTN